MKKYIMPTVKVATINATVILAGSPDNTVSSPINEVTDQGQLSKGNAIWGNDND